MLFLFAPAGIEPLFDELGGLDVPEGDMDDAIQAMNAVGQKYGVEYFSD